MSSVRTQPNPPSPATGLCQACGRRFQTRASDGRLRRHGFTFGRPGSDCPGSGSNPGPLPGEDAQHDHARRTS